MKVKINENSLKRVKLIVENDIVNDFNNECEKVNNKVDNLFNLIISTNINEFVENNSLIPKYEQQINTFNNVLNKKHDNVTKFINNLSDEEYDINWEDVHLDLDNKFQSLVYKKLNNINLILEKIRSIINIIEN